ncbi:MAG: hypothetical protein R3C52_00195 [Hyphomonadaceae bacterium]
MDRDLEQLLKDDEASIVDDGFSGRVMESARGGRRLRYLALFGAAGLGAGAAFEGVSNLVGKMSHASGDKAGDWMGSLEVSVHAPILDRDVTVHPTILFAYLVVLVLAVLIPLLSAAQED